MVGTQGGVGRRQETHREIPSAQKNMEGQKALAALTPCGQQRTGDTLNKHTVLVTFMCGYSEGHLTKEIIKSHIQSV